MARLIYFGILGLCGLALATVLLAYVLAGNTNDKIAFADIQRGAETIELFSLKPDPSHSGNAYNVQHPVCSWYAPRYSRLANDGGDRFLKEFTLTCSFHHEYSVRHQDEKFFFNITLQRDAAKTDWSVLRAVSKGRIHGDFVETPKVSKAGGGLKCVISACGIEIDSIAANITGISTGDVAFSFRIKQGSYRKRRGKNPIDMAVHFHGTAYHSIAF